MATVKRQLTTFVNGVLKTKEKPYPLQLEIINSRAKRKVICAGRRAGKTMLAAFIAVEALTQYKKVHIASTSQAQADVFWNQLVWEWLQQPIEEGIIEANINKHFIKYVNPRNRQQYGLITIKTGRDANAVRGTKADILILDECAFLSDAVWEVASPTLLDSEDSMVIFISTPNRRNWFFHMYQRAKQDATGAWRAWNFPSDKNPNLSKKGLAAIASEMPPDMYRQEILAEFLENDGSVFRNIQNICVAETQKPYAGEFVFGVDIGKQDDYTVVSVMDINTKTQVDVHRFNKTTWQQIISKIKQLYDIWRPFRILVEINNAGDVVAEALLNEDLPIDKWLTTGSTKQPLIESLVLAFDKETIKCLRNDTLISEFMSYEKSVSKSGRLTYSAPPRLHDDMVIATAISWQATLEAQMSKRGIELWA